MFIALELILPNGCYQMQLYNEIFINYYGIDIMDNKLAMY